MASRYIELVVSTAGALLALLLLVMILGYRRPRRFERILFFVAVAQLLYFCGVLLGLNTELYYPVPPTAPLSFALALVLVSAGAFPGLLVHLHTEYFRQHCGAASPRWLTPVVVLGYLPAAWLLTAAPQFLFDPKSPALLWPGMRAARVFDLWWGACLLGTGIFQLGFLRAATSARYFYRTMAGVFFGLGLIVLLTNWRGPMSGGYSAGEIRPVVMAFFLLPTALLGYAILRHGALEFASQHSLIYAVTGAFLALLYLALVRRIEGWLEPVFPPEATAAILLFTLVFLFEPLQRQVGRALRRRFRTTFEGLQRLEGELREAARVGDLTQLLRFASERIRIAFSLARVEIRLADDESVAARSAPGEARALSFPLRGGDGLIGTLEVGSHGAALSGETFAALEALAGQLPAILDLCRLIEEKLALERELAERERLALVGQMAATISHNLKNPLGSIKTVLQVRLEDGDMRGEVRRDIELVLGEIERLSAKLNQLLRYSRPAVRSGIASSTDAVAVARQTVSLLSREAERRGSQLEFVTTEETLPVQGGEETLGDVISNLVVNAIEALPRDGRVRVSLERRNAEVVLQVCDNGPGIPAASREKIFQPFFTTKPSGTGLGLAIVERRVAELGGTISWKSPLEDGCGACFTVKFPLGK